MGGNDDNDDDEDDGTMIALPVVRFVGNRVGMGESLLIGRGGDGCASNERAGDNDNIDGGMRDDSSDHVIRRPLPDGLQENNCCRMMA